MLDIRIIQQILSKFSSSIFEFCYSIASFSDHLFFRDFLTSNKVHISKLEATVRKSEDESESIVFPTMGRTAFSYKYVWSEEMLFRLSIFIGKWVIILCFCKNGLLKKYSIRFMRT